MQTREAIRDDLLGMIPATAALYERASSLIPGGFSRARYFWPLPVAIDHGDGATVVDIDGREYIDCLTGFGAMILGHRHPAVTEAIEQQVAKGVHFGTVTPVESDLAELLIDNVPGAERTIFINSGTEATLAAVRIARAATGRSKIAKFEGGWHGQNDYLQHSFYRVGGPVTRPEVVPDPLGVPDYVLDDLVMLPFNHEAALDLLAEQGDEIACVFIEGVQGAAGVLPAERDFAHAVREACDRTGTLLAFDEVITGFRLGPGGAAAELGVVPDISTLGKAIGGGLPIGAVCGREDLFRQVLRANDGERFVVLGGTFSSNPMSMAAGAAQLKVLVDDPDQYAYIDRLGARMRDGLERMIAGLGIDGHVTGAGSMWGLHLVADPPTSIRGVRSDDSYPSLLLAGYLLREGVLMAAPVHLCFVSTAHTEDMVDEVIAAHERALAAMRADGVLA